MKKVYFLIYTILSIFIQNQADAAIRLDDEGVNQGYVNAIDCSGAGIDCTKSGIVATLTVPGGGAATAAGADKQIQFNDGGVSLGADQSFVWNKSGNFLAISRDSGQTGPAIIISSDTGASLAQISHDGTATFPTVDTGQGQNELYDMNQNVETTSSPTFAGLTLSSPLTVANGGTGAATHTDGGLLIGKGTAAFENTGVLAKGTLVVGDGTTNPTTLVVGAMGQILSVDTGSTGGIAWVSTPTSGGTPGGSTANVQYNNAGSFAGDSSFSWNASENTLGISRDVGQVGFAIVISSDTGASLASISHDGSAVFPRISADVVTLTGNGTLNGLDAIDATGEATLEANLDIAGDVASTGMASTVIQDNSVDGTDIALGSDVAGDVMYYDGTNWVRLAIGTAGQVLEVNAGATAPEWDADDNSGGATAWNDIGDAAGDGSVDFGGTTQIITGNTNDITAIDQDLLKLSFTNDAATDILTQRGLVIQNEASANGMEALIALNNDDADDAVTSGIIINTGDGTITNAIDVSDAQIGNAILVGANPIATGNVAGTLGDATTDSWTVTTDGTGTGEVVLPDESIGAAEIANASITTTDISGSAGITAAQTALTAGRSLTFSTNDISADVELYTRTICMRITNPTGADFQSAWVNDSANQFTVTKLWCESDQTVNTMLQVDDGSASDMDTVDLACVSTPDTDTSLDGDATIAAGDRVDIDVASVSGTPTWCTICFTGTYDD